MAWGDPCVRCRDYNYDTFCITCIIKAVDYFKEIQVACASFWNAPTHEDAAIYVEIIQEWANKGRKALDETTS